MQKEYEKKTTWFPIILLSDWFKSQASLPLRTPQEQRKQVKYDWLVRVFPLLKPATCATSRRLILSLGSDWSE